jgi:multiple sugar transport system substrate-binding protein
MKLLRITRMVVVASMIPMLSVAGGASMAGAATKSTITVAYPSVYAFDTGPLATKWWNQVKAEFSAKYPNVKVAYVPIPGSYQDVVNKLSLLYRSPSTAPDVAEMPSAQIGLWASSNFLLPMNKYLGSTTWWPNFPKVIQSEGTFLGKVYAVNAGENDSALMYNKTMFKKAGIPVPWKPTSWADILSAAQKIKKALPGVTPLWLNAGTGSGGHQQPDRGIVDTDNPDGVGQDGCRQPRNPSGSVVLSVDLLGWPRGFGLRPVQPERGD